MPTKKWFVTVGDEEMGPLGPGGLRKLVRKGQITPATMLRREDHARAVFASQLRGLLPAAADLPDMPVPPEPPTEEGAASPHRHGHRPQAVFHGPYTSLTMPGWTTAALLFAFALLGLLGVVVGMEQVGHAGAVRGGAALDPAVAGAGLFELGLWSLVALALAGSCFLWWLWTARVNLPHLIHAHIRLSPSWAVAAWFVPLANFLQPYAIVAETDQLSAEADADGDASIKADHRLLLPWWLSAVLGTILAIVYLVIGKGSGEALWLAGWVHVLAGVCTLVAGVLCGWVVLRVTRNQERAHDRHPEPVEPHHAIARHRRPAKIPVLRAEQLVAE